MKWIDFGLGKVLAGDKIRPEKVWRPTVATYLAYTQLKPKEVLWDKKIAIQ